MGLKLYPRNEPCPCGSGEKYKRCCFQKGFTYRVDDETGEVIRAVPLTRDALSEPENSVAAQRDKFVAKFGREPGPDDPSSPSSSTWTRTSCARTPPMRCAPPASRPR
jgi:SEC-C motif